MLLPEWFARLLLFFVTRTLYRVKVFGRENFPQKSGALLVCNHMSFVDAALLIAATDRPIRFLMYQGIYDLPMVKPFARIMKAIPISSEQHPREMIRSLQTAADALRQDEIVCIFAEGQITRTGQLLPFRRGLERIMKGVDVPDHPGQSRWCVGKHLQLRARAFLVEDAAPAYPIGHSQLRPADAVDLNGDRGARRSSRACKRRHTSGANLSMQTLDRAFVRTARRHPLALHDGRWEDAKSHLWLCAYQDDVHCTQAAEPDRHPAHGGRIAAALRGWRAHELCADAAWPRAGEPELHLVERSHRIVRPAVRDGCGDHREGIRRALS